MRQQRRIGLHWKPIEIGMALRKGFIRGFVGLLGFMLLPMAESAQLYRYCND